VKSLLCISILVLATFGTTPDANANCSGRFINPVTDPCWRCTFPLRIGATKIWGLDQADNDSSLQNSMACSCADGAYGLNIGLWEPAHVMDVSTSAFCTPSLGGEIIPGLDSLPGASDGGVAMRPGEPGQSNALFHFFAYRNPILVAMNFMSDNPCLEHKPFDLLDMSAANPTWADEALGAILQPDSFLFGTLAAVLVGIPHGVCSTLQSEDPVCMTLRRWAYWSNGFNSQTFPLSGFRSDHYSYTGSAQTIMKRGLTVQHRTLRVWGTSGKLGMCSQFPQLMMDDTDYKVSMLYPMAQSTPGVDGRCCQPMGASDMVWGAGRTWPVTGEDQSYLVFKKRDCCLAVGNINNTFAPDP